MKDRSTIIDSDVSDSLLSACSAIKSSCSALAQSGSKMYPKIEDVAASFYCGTIMASLHLEEILEANPKHPEALMLLSTLKLLHGNKDESHEYIIRFLHTKSPDKAYTGFAILMKKELVKEKHEIDYGKILKRQLVIIRKLQNCFFAIP